MNEFDTTTGGEVWRKRGRRIKLLVGVLIASTLIFVVSRSGLKIFEGWNTVDPQSKVPPPSKEWVLDQLDGQTIPPASIPDDPREPIKRLTIKKKDIERFSMESWDVPYLLVRFSLKTEQGTYVIEGSLGVWNSDGRPYGQFIGGIVSKPEKTN